MLGKVIGFILALILVLTGVLFEESLIGDISESDGKYSIYINNVFYGTVEDRTPFDDYINETYEKYNKESTIGAVYAPDNYSIDSVTGAFDTNKTDEEILEAFKENVEFLVDGYKVSIVKESKYSTNEQQMQGGEVKLTSKSNYAILYSTDKEEVDTAFSKILGTFIDEQSIERINRGETIDNFDVGTEEVLSYNVGGIVVGSETKVPYNKVLVGEELYNKMLFYNISEDKKYTVQDGDTIEDIAMANMLNVNELVAANKSIINENTILSPGQEVVVNLVDPVVTVESTKILVKEEVVPYETEVIEDDTMLTTEASIIKEEGSDGKVERVYEIDYLNGQSTSAGEIVSETQITTPTNRVVVKGTKQAPSYTTTYSNSGISGYTTSVGTYSGESVAWGRPTQGGYFSSPFGPRWGVNHDGIDIAGLPTGSTIMSVYDGVVVYTGYQGARGNLVIIDHQNGFVTYSQHLSDINVSVGDTVYKGQRIGGMGSTGYSTGVHLHFEIFINGGLVDPMTVYAWI
ncbi:MAG: peptidoglycan DD-metalloendopeptidase family protein [Bacilli bacterium]